MNTPQFSRGAKLQPTPEPAPATSDVSTTPTHDDERIPESDDPAPSLGLNDAPRKPNRNAQTL